MRWLWFLGALLCFSVVFRTTSMALALLALGGALVFMLVGTLAVAAQRIDSRRRDATSLLRAETAFTAAATDEEPAAGVAEPGIVGLAAAGAMIAAEAAGRASGADVPPAAASTDPVEPDGEV